VDPLDWSILVSLWSVSDQSTALLMVNFYRLSPPLTSISATSAEYFQKLARKRHTGEAVQPHRNDVRAAEK
jgi:CHAT domain-containing protein